MYTHQLVHPQNELKLSNIEFYGFDKEGIEVNCSDSEVVIWVGSANFYSNPLHTEIDQSSFISDKSEHQYNQKNAVRLLLNELIKVIPSFRNQKNIILDESTFPYRLNPNGYFVSFSHSKDKVACAICQNKPIGIDIELNSVPIQTAERFYNLNEINWVHELDNKNQQIALNLLWMLKEATIKRNSNNTADNTLIKGLSLDLTAIAQYLLSPSNKLSRDMFANVNLMRQSYITPLELDSSLYIFIKLPNDGIVLAV